MNMKPTTATKTHGFLSAVVIYAMINYQKKADNIQYLLNVLDEIDNSYESEYDKHEPRLLLYSFCKKEYNISSYLIPLN